MSSHFGSSSGLLRLLLGAVLGLPLMAACGGRSDTEDYLFGSANGDGGFANGQGGISNGSGGNDGDGPPRPGGPGSGGASVTRGGASAGGSVSAGGSAAAGAPFGGMGAGGFGMAGSPTITPLGCGPVVCDAETQFCCAGLGGYACLAAGSACNGAVLACTSSADCGGEAVCCLTLTDPVGSASYCQDSCGGNGQRRERQLCQTDAECRRGRCSETVFGVSVCTRGNGG